VATRQSSVAGREPSDSPTVVFLHGAGTGAWIWERVIRVLPANAFALDIPGRTRGATPDSCAAALVAEIDRRNTTSVVLVLHSLAGVLAAPLTARLGPRLHSCVFLSAVIPPPGGAFVDALGFANRLVLRVLFRLNPAGLKPSSAMIRRELCNDLSEEDAELVISRYEAEMPGLYLTPVDAPLSLSRSTYIKLLDDQSVPPSQQDKMIARLHNCRTHEINAGHLAMLSSAETVAELILKEL
jgi:pimeloyl-ACP methyl ester carboxylesterase